MSMSGVLRLRILDSKTDKLVQARVTISLEHRRRSHRKVLRDVDASSPIEITELHTAPDGVYKLLVKSTKYFPVGNFVSILPSGTTDLEAIMEPKSEKVVLDLGRVRVDADPLQIGQMIHDLILKPEVREKFAADPVAGLKNIGIEVPEEFRSEITPQSIRGTLENMIEGSYAVSPDQVAILPAVGVSVGTDPGTAPVVIVGVEVATETSTFSLTDFTTLEPARVEELKQGLEARYASEAKKRADREEMEAELKLKNEARSEDAENK